MAIRDLHQTCRCQGWYLPRHWVQGFPTFPPSALGPTAWARSWADRAGVIGPAEWTEGFPRRGVTQQVVVVKLGSSCSYVHLFSESTSQLVFVWAKSLQSCPTLCNPINCSLPGFSVQGILQASVLEWVAMPSSRGSSLPRDQTHVSYVSCIGSQVLYH